MVKHKTDCQRVFSRYDLTCPRCQELNGGAAARPGWGHVRKAQEAQTIAAIRRHDFVACAKNNIVCTCFDY